MEEFSYRELEAATNGFSLSSLIGKGSHGCVHKALLHTPTKPPFFVAIKKPSLSLQLLQDTSKLQNEIQILSSLPRTPYLVNLLGLSHDSAAAPATAESTDNNNNNILLVMELMPNSSLHDLLHSTHSPPPNWPSRALVALQLARALQFLHDSNPPVIHRDVKPTNVLFDSNWNAKLADFGLAVRYHHHHYHRVHDHSPCNDHHRLSQPAGTIGYIDPAYTTPAKLSTKNDVYSFGVVLLEILSGRRAIDVAMEPASVVEWAVPLVQQDRVDEILDSRIMAPSGSTMKVSVRTMLGIAARCVSMDQRLRPCMKDIVTELQNSVVVVERVRFSSWRTILLNGFTKRRRRKKDKALVVIRCRAEEEEEEEEEEGVMSLATRSKVSIREILTDETH